MISLNTEPKKKKKTILQNLRIKWCKVEAIDTGVRDFNFSLKCLGLCQLLLLKN